MKKPLCTVSLLAFVASTGCGSDSDTSAPNTGGANSGGVGGKRRHSWSRWHSRRLRGCCWNLWQWRDGRRRGWNRRRGRQWWRIEPVLEAHWRHNCRRVYQLREQLLQVDSKVSTWCILLASSR